MNRIVAVAVGGAIGTLLRYLIQNWSLGRFGATFPYGTMMVNVIGAFLIGAVMTLLLRHLHISPVVRVFLVTGILGGFTTFSSLAWETYALAADGRGFQSVIYAAGTFAAGMFALCIGVLAGRLF